MPDTPSADRYFVTDEDGIERETDAAGFIAMERRCGFQPKPGCGPFATGGFFQSKPCNGHWITRTGRIERGGGIKHQRALIEEAFHSLISDLLD